MDPLHAACRPHLSRRTWLAGLALLSAACAGSEPSAFARLRSAQALSAQLALALGRSQRAAERAVLAVDVASATSAADEAEQARAEVERDTEELGALLATLQATREQDLLERFRLAFQAYAARDREMLALAVKKTNTRALALTYGPALAAADDVVQALSQLRSDPSAPAVAALTVEAALRERQALLPAHVAEADDAAMDALEARMRASSDRMQAALESLARSVTLAPSTTASLARFEALAQEILTLSRENTDVRSRALTLGEMRALGTSAEGALGALTHALDERSAPARR